MIRKKARNVLIITALLFIPMWLTIHDSRLAEAGWSSPLNDFLVSLLIPLAAALTYEFAAAKTTKNTHKLVIAGAIAIVVALLWFELAANGLHETASILFG